MADIRQAARWLTQGRDVRRQAYERWWVTPYFPKCLAYQIVCGDGGQHELDLFDLQADDWELVALLEPIASRS